MNLIYIFLREAGYLFRGQLFCHVLPGIQFGILIIWGIILFFPPSGYSQIPPKIGPADFAASLMAKKDYYRASEELIPIVLTDPYKEPAFSMLLESAYRLKDPNIIRLITEKYQTLDEPFQTRLIQTLSLIVLKNDRPDEAKLIYGQLDNISPKYPSVNKTELKNVKTAETSSMFIPGAGLFYTGEYGKGTGAFLLNALFIYLTVNAYEKKNYGGALLFLFFEYQFYTGSIRASAESAEKYNQNRQNAVLDEFTAKLELSLFSY